jgi:hypothetical protein
VVTTLFLSAQDIHTLRIALLQGSRVLFTLEIQTTPECFLEAISTQLSRWQTRWGVVQRVVVVCGPGSFTSTRVIVTIANSIAFARHVPVIGTANPLRIPFAEFVVSKDWSFEKRESAFASPVYDRPPHITSART